MPMDEFRRKVKAADGEMIKATLTDPDVSRRALDAAFHDWPWYFKPRERVLFFKGGPGSGWRSPAHGGTHVKQAPHEDGKDLGDRRPLSLTVKPSGEVSSFDQARAWWSANLGGKVVDLTVHLGRTEDSWKRTHAIKVDFPANETHAYTEKAADGVVPDCYDDERRKLRPRSFVADRAQLMDRIIQTIEYPKAKAVQYGADLLFERVIGGQHFVVALMWSDARGLYVFDSAYLMTGEKMRLLVDHKDRRRNNCPLQKSEPSGSAPSVFRASTEAGSYPTGSKPVTCESIGFCRCCNSTLLDVLLKGKPYTDLSADADRAMLKAFPLPGDAIEFLSDRQIEAGPLATAVVSVEGDTVHLLVNDEPVWLDWPALEIDSVTHRDGRGVWTMKALGPAYRLPVVRPVCCPW